MSPVRGKAKMETRYPKTFIVTDRDDASPDPSTWQIVSPSSATTQPLEIKFPESLDYYILKERVQLFGASGNLISGKIEVSNNERTFKFFPDHPWSPGDFMLEIEARLEDLAGNNLNRPFDRNVEQKTKRRKIFLQEKSRFINRNSHNFVIHYR